MTIGQFKLNTNVSIVTGQNSVGLGVVIREHNGYVVAASSSSFPGCLSLLNAELIGVHEGLSFAKSLGCELSVLKYDSLVVINGLKC
ncbi:Ribonuclease H-like domain containing protein [Trema orientale]|uniref:Ribonuclease H-like domain containing protein n=1 Tax=Trema orientale TaxID=63057 RepID=A0A2P5BNN7_TREOI|nr:Ribonuclease H-like domain containing protein [Trema orientale]